MNVKQMIYVTKKRSRKQYLKRVLAFLGEEHLLKIDGMSVADRLQCTG
jgi:hypothetical protein